MDFPLLSVQRICLSAWRSYMLHTGYRRRSTPTVIYLPSTTTSRLRNRAHPVLLRTLSPTLAASPSWPRSAMMYMERKLSTWERPLLLPSSLVGCGTAAGKEGGPKTTSGGVLAGMQRSRLSSRLAAGLNSRTSELRGQRGQVPFLQGM